MVLSRFKNLGPKQKIILVSAAGLLICFSIYLLMHFTIVDIKNLKRSIVDEKINLEKQNNSNESTIMLSDKLKKIEPQLEIFERIFINENRELEFITALEGVAGRYNINQKLELPPPAETNNIYRKSSLKIDLQGNFRNIINYLTEIEALNYYININQIIIGTSQKNDSSVKLAPSPVIGPDDPAAAAEKTINMNISAETYWK